MMAQGMAGDDTSVVLVELMTPDMANFYGTIHGGTILSFVDKAAFVCASRYAGTGCVTASVHQVDFLAPIYVGEVVTFLAKVDFVGRTSMDLNIRITAEDLRTGVKRLVNTCHVTMVAIKDGKPSPVPPYTPRTPEEIRMFAEAQVLRKLKKEHAAEAAKTFEEMDGLSPKEDLLEW